MCYSTKLYENATPREYADIAYNMIAAFLSNKHKKLT